MSKRLGISCNALSLGGGMERYTLDLIKELNQRGVQPVVFTKKVDDSLLNTLNIELHICNCGWCPSKLRDYYYSKWLSQKKITTGVDVLIGCNRNFSSDIAICGGTHKGYITAINRHTFSDRLTVKLERLYFNNAKFVVAHSNLMKTELTKYYDVPQTNIKVLYPPVNQETFHLIESVERNEIKEKLGFSSNKKSFLFISSSHKRKGLPILLDYFEHTNLPIELVIIGKPLNRTIRNVICKGYTTEIENFYWASDFTILASSYEPFGLVGIESILCGTPVLLSENIGCTEIIKSDAFFSFKCNDIQSLGIAINKAISSTERLGENIITEKLSLKSHFETLLELTEQL